MEILLAFGFHVTVARAAFAGAVGMLLLLLSLLVSKLQYGWCCMVSILCNFCVLSAHSFGWGTAAEFYLVSALPLVVLRCLAGSVWVAVPDLTMGLCCLLGQPFPWHHCLGGFVVLDIGEVLCSVMVCIEPSTSMGCRG